MADNKRLGRGLEALISSYSTENEGSINGAIEVDKIVPNRNQPRQEFNTEKLNDLVKSIKSVGILQPLTVRETKDQYFELVAGERRLRAAKIVGLKAVPAYILSINADVEMMEFALIENVQREDLNTHKQPSKDVHIAKLEDELISHLGTKVLIRSRKGKGKIQIDFFSDDDLQRILDIIL